MSGVIVSVKPGKSIPPALSSKITKDHFDAIVVAAPDEGGVVDLPFPVDANIDKSIDNTLSMFKDVPCNLYFSTPVKGLKRIDRQPFPLIFDNSGEKVLISAMLEGAFPKYSEDGYTSAFCVVRDLLADAMKDLYQENKENLAKTMFAADSASFRRLIGTAMGGQRGAILLIPAEGSPVLLAKGVMDDNGTGVQGDWGWSTQSFGYTEAKPGKETPQPADTTKVLSKREQLEAMLASRPDAAPPFEPDKPGEKPVTAPPGVKPDKTDTRTAPPGNEVLIKCPFDIESKQGAVRQWISRNIEKAYIPTDGLGDGKGFPEKAFRKDAPAISSFKSFAEAAAAFSKRATPDEPVKVTNDYIPIMGPKTKEHMVKLIGDGDKEFAPEIQNLEAPYRSFTEELALDEDVPLFWKPGGFLRLAQQDMFGAALLMEELRRRVLKLDPSIDAKMKAKMKKAEEPAAVVPTKKMSRREELEAQLAGRKTA